MIHLVLIGVECLISIAVPGGGARGQLPPKFSKYPPEHNSNFSGSNKKYLDFSASDMKNLGKVRNFRTAEMINCKHWLPNLGEDLFLENTLILGRKLGNMRLIPSEHFFLENTMIL